MSAEKPAEVSQQPATPDTSVKAQVNETVTPEQFKKGAEPTLVGACPSDFGESSATTPALFLTRRAVKRDPLFIIFQPQLRQVLSRRAMTHQSQRAAQFSTAIYPSITMLVTLAGSPQR